MMNKNIIGKKNKRLIDHIISYILLTFFSLLVLIPFYVIIITSVKSNSESMSPQFSWWPKEGFYFEGYKKIFLSSDFSSNSSILKGLLNTLWINIPTIVVGLFTASLCAYALTKIRFKGANVLFSILLVTMMIPSIITLTPSYLLYDAIGWTRTPLPLMIPGLFGGAACVFFMRQYMSGIPNELIDSAKIDGLGNFGVFFRIILPLSKPALLAQFLIIFIGRYNDYIGPLLYLTGTDVYTLQIALRYCMGTYLNDWQALMSGCVVSLVPLVIIYIFAQKIFIEGISISSGIKG